MDALSALAGLGIFVLGGIVVYVLKPYFSGYAEKKGGNRADKEDIEELTRKVEAIRTDNAKVLEEFREAKEFRFAALDKRLQAHQEAFALWWRLVTNIDKPELLSTIVECQDWWSKNCLYLEPEVDDAFCNSFQHALDHPHLSKGKGVPRTASDLQMLKDNWAVIVGAGNVIRRAARLPPFPKSTLAALEAAASKQIA